ncbi:hypothetical protein F4803DRAFT_527013 [Xylaria telfairii]|nr:hypothetical protein F4803DRAFT_527013 [Xylaria telfairii]
MESTSSFHSSEGSAVVPTKVICSVTTSNPARTTNATSGETEAAPNEATSSGEDSHQQRRDHHREVNIYMIEERFQQTLLENEMQYGPEHQNTVEIMVILGDLYIIDKGEFGKAERFYRKALSIRERTFGYNHESTIACMSKLAALFSESGRFEEAEHLCKQALPSLEKTVGRSHILTMNTRL